VEIYKASDIFAVMSTAETQCLSMMKAMSTGIPVIGADARALPDYIGRDEKRGFVIPIGNVSLLAEKIIFLFNNPDEQKKMGQAGIDFVKNFSARSITLEWEKIFNEAIEEYKKKD
jgi:glycosyltransferase involved in cell wall biosynthesis